MNDLQKVSADLSNRAMKFILSLQTLRHIDLDSFEAILDCIKSASEILKRQENVPKAFLKDLRIVSKTLRAEAPHFGDEASTLLKMAERLEYLFDLILLGESQADRKPGVPRFS
jgi:hypothetical protein